MATPFPYWKYKTDQGPKTPTSSRKAVINMRRFYGANDDTVTDAPTVGKDIDSVVNAVPQPTSTPTPVDKKYNLVRGGTVAVAKYQEMLAEKGLYKGKIDGAWGPLTDAAYNTYIGKDKKTNSSNSASTSPKSNKSKVPASTPSPTPSPSPAPAPSPAPFKKGGIDPQNRADRETLRKEMEVSLQSHRKNNPLMDGMSYFGNEDYVDSYLNSLDNPYLTGGKDINLAVDSLTNIIEGKIPDQPKRSTRLRGQIDRYSYEKYGKKPIKKKFGGSVGGPEKPTKNINLLNDTILSNKKTIGKLSKLTDRLKKPTYYDIENFAAKDAIDYAIKDGGVSTIDENVSEDVIKKLYEKGRYKDAIKLIKGIENNYNFFHDLHTAAGPLLSENDVSKILPTEDKGLTAFFIGKNRANYTPGKKIIKGDGFSDIIAEIAHAKQEKDGQNLNLRIIEDWFKDPYITTDGHERQYDREGSLEHEAHSVIEPKLHDIVLKKFDLYNGNVETSEMDKSDKKDIKKLRYGGKVKRKPMQYSNGGLVGGGDKRKIVKGGTTAVANYQEMLKEKGLYNGAIDGAWGPITDAAYNTYLKTEPSGGRGYVTVAGDPIINSQLGIIKPIDYNREIDFGAYPGQEDSLAIDETHVFPNQIQLGKNGIGMTDFISDQDKEFAYDNVFNEDGDQADSSVGAKDPYDRINELLDEREKDVNAFYNSALEDYDDVNSRVSGRNIGQLVTSSASMALQNRRVKPVLKRPYFLDKKYEKMSAQQINQNTQEGSGAAVEMVKQLGRESGSMTSRLAPILMSRLLSNEGRERRAYIDQNRKLERAEYAERGDIMNFNDAQRTKSENEYRDNTNRLYAGLGSNINKFLAGANVQDLKKYSIDQEIKGNQRKELYDIDNVRVSLEMANMSYDEQLQDVQDRIENVNFELQKPDLDGALQASMDAYRKRLESLRNEIKLKKGLK